MDDLIGIAPTEHDLDNAEKAVERKVELDKRGRPTNMLGMELHWSEGKVILTQTRLIDSMCSQYLEKDESSGGIRSLPLNTVFYARTDPTSEDTPPPKYQAIVGGLLFIVRMSRPEISVHVNLLGRRTKDASPENWKAALTVLRYLRSTKHDGLT